MSYRSEVLADNPVLYYPLDMVGPATNGDPVPDISGNGLDGETEFTFSAIQPYGYPSAIETDSASRAFLGNNDPFVGVARILRDSDSLIEVAGDFALECWIRILPPGASHTPQMYVGKGSGNPFLTNCFFIGTDLNSSRFVGGVWDSANTLWTVTDTGIGGTSDALFDGSFHHVVLVRFGDALAIYTDGQLGGVTTIASSLPTLVTGDPFFIHCPQTAPMQALYDEVALYDYAPNAARWLVHYEAALNELLMRGEASIRITAVLNGTDEPDPAAYSFRHNWDQRVVERFRFKSSVFKPVNGSTRLRRQRSAPRRQVEYQHLLYSERLRQQFEARSFAGRTTLVQFEPDKVRVEALAEGATTATFDTRYRDFEPGHRVLVYQDDDTYEFATLSAVTDDGIEWDEPLTRPYTNVWVKPARVARLPLEQEVELQSDVYADASTIYEYLAEDEPLNPRRIVPFTPTLTHYDRETFDLAAWQGHDYNELPTITFTSDRSELDDGTGVVSSKQYRWGGEMVQPYNMNLQGRETIARYLGWLYARAGQYAPFWMPTFRNDLTVVGAVSNELTVVGHEYTNYYANADTRLDLAFVYFDNTTVTRRVLSATVDGSNDVLSLDAAVPTLTGLRYLSFLRRVILSSDDLEIAWETDNVVRVAFAVTDAPLDAEFGSSSVSPSPSASLSASLSPSLSASRSLSPSASASPSVSISPTISPSSSTSHSASSSTSPSPSV